jgi:type II secretory pathway component PulJ
MSVMRPLSPPRRAWATSGLREEHGFTLVEMLVATFTGLVVIFAAFSIVDVSLHQSSRIADRTSADQRGRLALEKIVLKLHSSCVAPETTPVEPGSTESKLLIVSQTGSEASFATVTLHEVYLEAGKLIDTSYLNTGSKPAPNWEFSKVANSKQVLLTNVTKSLNGEGKEIPIFQYYKYEGTELTKLAESPLSAAGAEATAAISVSFTSAPESGNVGKIKGDRTVDLTDTAVLRFSPTSAIGTNRPCA